MPGEGFMLHMIQTLRNNRELKRSIRRKFKKDQLNRFVKTNRKIQYKEFSKMEVQKAITKNQERQQADKKKKLWLNIITFLVTFVVVVWFLRVTGRLIVNFL